MKRKPRSWPINLLSLTEWAIQSVDLRHRFLFAKNAAELPKTAGIANALETIIVLCIYEAAIAKGYVPGKTVDYERPYPGTSKGNPKRADLAFKDPGKGKNWGYIEVKSYSKSAIRKDVAKLRKITQRSQRWTLCYRVRPNAGKGKPLRNLLTKSFAADLKIIGSRWISSATRDGKSGICEIVLSRVN